MRAIRPNTKRETSGIYSIFLFKIQALHALIYHICHLIILGKLFFSNASWKLHQGIWWLKQNKFHVFVCFLFHQYWWAFAYRLYNALTALNTGNKSMWPTTGAEMMVAPQLFFLPHHTCIYGPHECPAESWTSPHPNRLLVRCRSLPRPAPRRSFCWEPETRREKIGTDRRWLRAESAPSGGPNR